ncbi:MAG: hypothetical protein JOZ51_12620 [Chloroflexi bacterium]|nr:hypothetical protein [Chloroflexota bacterium]
MREFVQKRQSMQRGVAPSLPQRLPTRSRPTLDQVTASHVQRSSGAPAALSRSQPQDRDPGAGPSLPHTRLAGHDFSQIAVHAPPAQGRASLGAKGELAGSDELFGPLKGEPDGGTAVVADAAPTKGEAVKKVKKTELAAPTAGECGAYSWKVRFSVENADASTTGYIVQKVKAVYKRQDCVGNDKPVTGIGTFPFWEAWGVRGGKVFVGDTASEHNADTYTDPAMGDSIGSIAVKGTAEFFPNVTLPAHMKARNPATQAGDLRSSTTDPALTGGTGSIPHDLTASWDCCGPLLPGAKERQTTFSNKR